MKVLGDSFFDSRLNNLIKYLPKELKDYVISLGKNDLDSRYIQRFDHSKVPFHFYMNVRGGWITPDANWYLPTQSADTDLLLKRRLVDPRKYKFNTRLQAYQEGYVRIDYSQPVFDNKYSLSKEQPKVVSFAFEIQALQNQRIFWAIQSIAYLYNICIPEPISFEIRLVSDKNETIKYTTKRFRKIQYFLLELQTMKNRGY